MATPTPTSFLVRARKQEITHLRKKIANCEKRRGDIDSAIALYKSQIADHEAEIKKVGGAL